MSAKAPSPLDLEQPKPLIDGSLCILNAFGVNPKNQNLWSAFKASITLLIFVHLNVESWLYLVIFWEGWDSVEAFTASLSLIQMTYKTKFMISHKKQFRCLLQTIEGFWPWGELDESIQGQIRYTSGSTIRVIKLLLAVTLLSVETYPLKPLFSNGRMLLLEPFMLDESNSTHSLIIHGVKIFITLLACVCALAFDCLFMSFIIHFICELKILKHRFLTIKVNLSTSGDDKCTLMQMCGLIKHHNLVLGAIRDMKKIYSSIFLSQLSTAAVCLCFGLLSVIKIGFPPDMQQLSKYVTLTSIIAIMSQLLIYCFMGTLLVSESHGVSDAVYSSVWWFKSQPKLRKACVLIIQRANKKEKLKAFGLVTMDLHTFAMIMRFGLAVFSLFQALCKRQK